MFNQLFIKLGKIDIFKFLIYAVVVAIIPYFNISGSTAMGLGALALSIALFSSVELCALCVVYTIPFAIGVQGVFGGINLNNAIQLLLIVKSVLYGKELLSFNKAVTICSVALIIQLLPIIACAQSLLNVMILAINMMLYLIYYRLIKDSKIPYITIFVAFSLGVLISCFVALYGNFQIKNSEFIEYDFFRFCGMWTDPNFLGAFCNIVLATCLCLSQGKTKNLLLLSPIMLLSLFYGFKTLSFTYIILLISVIGVFLISNIKDTGKLFIIGFICVVIVAPYVIGKIDDVLSVRIVGDNTDVSHGRFSSSMELLTIWFSNIKYLLFGYGYNNTIGAINEYSGYHLASHNTYVDIFIELGLLLNIVLWGIIVSKGFISRKYIKPLFSSFGIITLITLLTLGTVSGLKYEFVFIFFACYIAQVENEYSINKY